MITLRGEVVRIYLPPDANSLLSVADHCLRSRDYVNLIVIDKQPQLQYLTSRTARAHAAAGASGWEWAGTDDGRASPTWSSAAPATSRRMETLAAAWLLRRHTPELRSGSSTSST